MKQADLIRFLDQQNLNGLYEPHMEKALAMLAENNVAKVPTLATAMRWIHKRAYPKP